MFLVFKESDLEEILQAKVSQVCPGFELKRDADGYSVIRFKNTGGVASVMVEIGPTMLLASDADGENEDDEEVL